MSKSRINSKKGITVRFESEDYEQIKQKARQRHYDTIAEYIRDRVFSETVIYEDYDGKEKICEAFNEMRAEMIQQESQMKELMIRCIDDKSEKEDLEVMIAIIRNQREKIERKINDLLFRDFVREKENIENENPK